jgi:hypothetical protein
MKEKAKKIKCDLIVRGSNKANATAKTDLNIKDPSKDRALAIIDEALDKEHEQDDQRTTSEKIDSDNKKNS